MQNFLIGNFYVILYKYIKTPFNKNENCNSFRNGKGKEAPPSFTARNPS